MMTQNEFTVHLCSLVNSAIKVLMDSDPANSKFIDQLSGARIRISVSAPKCVFLLHIDNGNISFADHSSSDEPSGLEISGTAMSLMQLLTTPLDDASALSNASVSVQGDVGLLLKLSQVAKMIEIDWEGLLSERIGDAPAVIFSRILSAGLREAHKIHSDFSEKVAQNAQSDSSPLPNRKDLKAAKDQLKEMNYRLDRLEAKRSLNQTQHTPPQDDLFK